MTTLLENSRAVGSSAYWGDYGHWLIASAITRDSNCLERSNFRCIEKALKALPAVKEWQGEFTPVTIERFSHWAVGWCDYLVIDPECKPAVELAESIRAGLENYPVVDDDDFSELEADEANETWRNCYRPKERVEYIRKHRSQFEFADFKDLIGCVRGNYFAGYASELIG